MRLGPLLFSQKRRARCSSLSKRWVRTFVEELDVARVKTGQRAEVTCDSLPCKVFAGTVTEVLPRMGKRSLQTDAPSEYKDVYYREVLIDLDAGAELLLHAQVKTRIQGL